MIRRDSASGMGRRCLWTIFDQMRLDCMSCTETCGSGCKIAGTRAMRERRKTEGRGRVGTVFAECYVVARGTTLRGFCALQNAALASSISAEIPSGSALPSPSSHRAGTHGNASCSSGRRSAAACTARRYFYDLGGRHLMPVRRLQAICSPGSVHGGCSGSDRPEFPERSRSEFAEPQSSRVRGTCGATRPAA